MKKLFLSPAVMLLPLAVLAAPAHAGDAVADVDAHVSTLGAGMDIAIPVGDSVAARVGFNQFSMSYNTTTTSGAGTTINYNGNLKLQTVQLLADWHPFNGVTHLTAGVMINNNKVEAVGVEQTTNAVVNAVVDFNKTAPYLGFGWSGRASNSGWSFKSDIGVLYQGAARATLTTTNATLAANLATEQAALNDKLKNYKYYPVVSIGIGYAF
jgi:hypothetical protein